MNPVPAVYLVGFMGCGKSAAGAALAATLSVRFVDLDDEICRRLGASVSEIFRRSGEAAFRAEETEVLRWTGTLDRPVVATGGGTFCCELNRSLIHRAGVSVYLDLPWAVVQQRLPGKNLDRPKFGEPEGAERLYQERRPHYERASHTLALDGSEPPLEVARRILHRLGEGACAT